MDFFLCCAVLFLFTLATFFFKVCFRYASDAARFACTALELLILAEGLRAVSCDFVLLTGSCDTAPAATWILERAFQRVLLASFLGFDILRPEPWIRCGLLWSLAVLSAVLLHIRNVLMKARVSSVLSSKHRIDGRVCKEFG